MKTQAEAILDFYRGIKPDFPLPSGTDILNPFSDGLTWQLVSRFYKKFYADDSPRIFIFGINPGRFGGGLTGIPFTDPIRLEQECGIKNNLSKKPELSSGFIYAMIDRFGGVNSFYGKFMITSISPLGFVRQGKNLNYYDDKNLATGLQPFIISCIREQIESIPALDTCFCLGEGENYRFFQALNARHSFFKEIIPLPHPRWIMQYRRKQVNEFVSKYVNQLEAVVRRL